MTMKKIILIAIILSSQLAKANQIILPLGEIKSIQAAGATSVWAENKKILQLSTEGAKIIVKGLQIGESSVRVSGTSYRIQVVDPYHFDSYEKLTSVLSKIAGLKAEFKHGELIVSGKLFRMQDWIHIAQKNLSYQMSTDLSEELKEDVQIYFNNLLGKNKLPRLNIIFAQRFEVRVNPKNIYKHLYVRLFKDYGIKVIDDEDSLESAPTIKVQITVAEIKRKFNQHYGLRWPSAYSAKIISNKISSIDDILLSAEALEQQGYGKILASPNIICKSGKEAEFLAGGEFPIKIVNYKVQDIIWKKYGIHLKIKPKADSSGKMSLSIDTEVSTLDDSTKVDGVPGILTNHVSSHFDLLKPQTIALSGLLKNENAKSSEGLPALSRIPILGALFSSKDFREDKSELVIFVRPTILEDENDPSLSSSANTHLGDFQ